MTHTPQSSDTSGPACPCPEGDQPSRVLEKASPGPATIKPSRTPLMLLGLSVVIVAVGLIFSGGEPDTIEAEPAVPDVRSMTVEQLAQDAGLLAAKELTRRMFKGTPAERVAASSVVTRSRNPRLARHMAMVMTLEQQKRQQEIMRQMEQNRRTMERRHYGAGGGR